MELHELPKGVDYDDMTTEQQEVADKAIDSAILLGEAAFRTARQIDGRPAVILSSYVYAIMRTAVEAGKTKEAAKRMVDDTSKKLLEGLEEAFDNLWKAYGQEEPEVRLHDPSKPYDPNLNPG